MDLSQLSPMMRHYMETKKEYPDCILFYRLGDFYEMFFDDALTASKVLEITLTGKECGLPERAPMCNSATSFGAGLAVGMLAINNAKKIGTSTRKGLNTISKATGKYGNRFKNGLNTMTPNFQLGSKIESLSKNVKNAPTNAQNAIKGKFKNSKAGQKLSK